DRDVDADVVSPVGERDPGHSPDCDVLAFDLGVIVIASAPGLPGSPQPQPQGDEAEVRDDRWRQEYSGPQGDEHGRTQDAHEPQVLAGKNSCGGSALPGAAGEEQGEHDDVVNIRGDEQADRL